MTIASGFHLFPFRTEKLSPIAPMVLQLWESRSSPTLIKSPSGNWGASLFYTPPIQSGVMTPQPPQGGANTLSSKWNLSCFHRHCEEWNDEAILIMQNKIILSSGLLRRVASLRSQWRASISEFRKSDRDCFAVLAMTRPFISFREGSWTEFNKISQSFPGVFDDVNSSVFYILYIKV